jgi:Spy/CpxP family protein refolding chaperone
MRYATLLIAPLLLAGSLAARASDPPSPPPPPPVEHGDWGHGDGWHRGGDGDRGWGDHGRGWGHGERMMHRPHGVMMMHLLHRLDLTDAQRASIKAIHERQRAKHEQLMKDGREIHRALMETPPTDPGYAKAVARARDHAAAKVQVMADAWTEVYGVLTPAQRTRLSELLKHAPPHGGWGSRGPGADRHPPMPPAAPGPGPV